VGAPFKISKILFRPIRAGFSLQLSTSHFVSARIRLQSIPSRSVAINRCIPKICPSFISSSLINPLLLFIQVKPFKCLACDFRSAFNSGLREHVSRVHEKILSFKCEVNGCSFACFQKNYLKTHVKKVHEKGSVPAVPEKVEGESGEDGIEIKEEVEIKEEKESD